MNKLDQEVLCAKERIKDSKAELKLRHLIIGEAIGRKSSLDRIRDIKRSIREDERLIKSRS